MLFGFVLALATTSLTNFPYLSFILGLAGAVWTIAESMWPLLPDFVPSQSLTRGATIPSHDGSNQAERGGHRSRAGSLDLAALAPGVAGRASTLRRTRPYLCELGFQVTASSPPTGTLFHRSAIRAIALQRFGTCATHAAGSVSSVALRARATWS
jgi:hypothetical protein